MTARGGRRNRRLSEAERALWAKVAESVTPLAARPAESASNPAAATGSAKPHPSDHDSDPAPARRKPPPPAKRPKKAPATAPSTPPPVLAPPPRPPLAALEHKLRRRLARGVRAIDARIDLHGLRQDEAQRRLAAFLAMAQASGFKVVLVITGKGRPSADGGAWYDDARGVLKRAVPIWLSSPAARGLVVGFETADVTHGGSGALYVRIRRGGGRS